MDDPCRHCNRPYKWRTRGLCKLCYRNPNIVRLYGRMKNSKAAPGAADDYQTAEEIESLIAEQLPTMPRDRAERLLPELPRCILIGRGIRSAPRRELV